MTTNHLLTTKQAAEYLGCSVSWLAQARRKTAVGPPWRKLGARMVRYMMSDLVLYLDDQVRTSTSHHQAISQPKIAYRVGARR